MKNLVTVTFIVLLTTTFSYTQTYIRLSAGPDRMYQSYVDHLREGASRDRFMNSTHSGYTSVLGFTQKFNDRLAIELEIDYFKRERRVLTFTDASYIQKFSRLSLLLRVVPIKYIYLSFGPSVNFRFDSKYRSGEASFTGEVTVFDVLPQNVTTYGGNIGVGCMFKNFFINLNYLSEIPAQKWEMPDPPYVNGILYKRISSLRLTVGYSFKVLKKGAIKIKRKRTVRSLG